MNTTNTNPIQNNKPIQCDNSFALAVAVIRDRIETFSEDDKQDLYKLIPSLFSGNEEEKCAAQVTVNEILDQECFSIQKLEIPDAPTDELSAWIVYVSRRLKELRDQAGMTQEQMSKKSGIPQSHISRLERGEHSPTSKTIEKLAHALNVKAWQIDPSINDEN